MPAAPGRRKASHDERSDASAALPRLLGAERATGSRPNLPMPTIRNPILPGFRPDPSICRVGEDYFIANSTFEWFPGVALSHSRDLAHWRPIGHVVTRASQLDLRGLGNSLGLWAPSLSHDGERFHLIVCNVRTRIGPIKDMRVLLFTADDIAGPWSEPVALGGCGFDPSLFHDDDGRKYHLNIQWDYRDGKPRFGGIVIQEYDPQSQQPVGELRRIFSKPQLIEGPNLYKRDGWYYLMCAEGGTGWNHGISMARSRSLLGPYEPDAQPLLLTTRHSPGNPLQKAGHGELVETPAGEWYLVHLASRPVYPERRCILGRETCLQRVEWTDDGWLRLADGGHEPQVQVEVNLPSQPWPERPARDDFEGETLGPEWQNLRVPIDASWASLTARPGHLRLIGRESQHSLFEQSLVARRLESETATAQTCVEFAPTHFTQSAGLAAWYDTNQYYYLRITHDEARGRVLGVVLADDGTYNEVHGDLLDVNGWDCVHLRATFMRENVQFAASRDEQDWQDLGPAFDLTKLSDDYGSTMRFTGTMVALCCQDLNSTRIPADFDYFDL